jgi:hypothetical protein
MHPPLRAAPGFITSGDRLLYAGARMDAGRIEYWLDYLCALFEQIPPSAWTAPGLGSA